MNKGLEIVDNDSKEASTPFLSRKRENNIVRALRRRWGPSAQGYTLTKLDARGAANYRCLHRSTANYIIATFERGRIVVLAEYGPRP